MDFFLKNKSEVYDIFVNFHKYVQTQFNLPIQAFHSDWGGEYQKINKFLKTQGILHRIACPYTHEQNGLAERKIRHIVDTGLTLLAHGHVPFKFWPYAFDTAVSLINAMPTPTLQNSSPYTKFFHTSPPYKDYKVFGCCVYPLLRPYQNHKFTFRTTP